MLVTKWTVSILGLAALKIAFGVAGYFHAVAKPGGTLPDFGTLHMLVYGAVAALLIYNRDRDPRALWLGSAFALVGVVPSDRLFANLAGSSPWVDSAIHALSHLHPDTFLPLYFWLFFRNFPH